MLNRMTQGSRIRLAFGTSAFSFLACAIGGCGGGERVPYYQPPPPQDGEDELDAGAVDDSILGGIDHQTVLEWATPDEPAKIAAGERHTCAIRRDGAIDCWGDNDYGQLDAPDAHDFVQVSLGDLHSCGLHQDGTLSCWGAGSDDALTGSGVHLGQAVVPKQVKFKEVGAGAVHTCAVTVDDTLMCWGAGAPGTPSDVKPHFRQSIPPRGYFRGVTAGGAHSCAIDMGDDKVVCWGAGADDVQCDAFDYRCGQSSPPDIPFARLAGGLFHSCGLTLDGHGRCWGAGTTDDDCDPLSELVRGGRAPIDCGQSIAPAGVYLWVSASWDRTCMIDEHYHVVCFGWETSGMAAPPKDEFHQVAVGKAHACGIRRDGTLTCWGEVPGMPPADFPGKAPDPPEQP